MEVFFYIPVGDADRALECGLRLSQCAERTITLLGVKKQFIKTLLNPKDDDRFYDDRFVPLKVEVNPSEVFIADGTLYDDALNKSGDMELYGDSIILADKYIFGKYRKPECLIPFTISGESMTIMNKQIDVPVLYDNSEEFYIINEFERGKELYADFEEKVLYEFYKSLADKGLFKKYFTDDGSYCIFESVDDGRIISIKRY